MRLASILAAVLLVAIVGGITGAVLTNRWRSDDAPRPPSILAPGSPDGLTETLAELQLPADLRPGGGEFLAVFRSVTAAAESRTTWAANPCCPGPRVIYVLAGSYTAQAMNGPLTVYRAGVSAPESIERGTDVTLEPGDLAFVGQGTNLLLANQTSTPVRLLTWQLTTDSTSSGPSPQTDIPVGWTMEANVYQFDVVLPSGGLTLRLQRVILDPADVVEMPPRAFSQALKSGGAGAFIRRNDNAITNPGTESVDLYLLSLVPVEGDGTPSSGDTANP
jgi:quercetin dioxygenase-like cupin family protein